MDCLIAGDESIDGSDDDYHYDGSDDDGNDDTDDDSVDDDDDNNNAVGTDDDIDGDIIGMTMIFDECAKKFTTLDLSLLLFIVSSFEE